MKKGQHPRKWSEEQKLEIIKKHLNEHISIRALGKEYDADHSMIARWVRNYDKYGEKALEEKKHAGNKYAAIHILTYNLYSVKITLFAIIIFLFRLLIFVIQYF